MKRLGKRILLLLVAVLTLQPLYVWAEDSVYSLPWEEQMSVPAEGWPGGPEIGAEAAILIELSTGAILYEKNIHTQYYPASITKVLTSLLVLENADLDDTVTFSHDAVYTIEPGSSHIGIREGEEINLLDCMYGVLLASANEVSNAVGEHVAGGDINAFTDMMNKRAAELGCKNSHFMNAHGLPDEEHYTSAYDMSLIAKEAFKNETFREIIQTYSYVVPSTNLEEQERTIHNTHKLLTQIDCEGFLGGKTGYTDAAGNTLVSFAERDGMTLLCVILKGTSGQYYYDTINIFDYGFEHFKLEDISENRDKTKTDYSELIKEIDYIGDAENCYMAIKENNKVVLPVSVNFSELEVEISSKTIDNDSAATLIYTYDGRFVGYSDLITTSDESAEVLAQI